MSEGLAGQAASTGRRTGSCCCSCKSAISVGEARWSGPQRTNSVPDSSATLHVPSAPRQLLYTACPQCPQTAPLRCMSPVPPDSSATLSAGRCVTLLLPVLIASASVCRGVGWGAEGEADWKHE